MNRRNFLKSMLFSVPALVGATLPPAKVLEQTKIQAGFDPAAGKDKTVYTFTDGNNVVHLSDDIVDAVRYGRLYPRLDEGGLTLGYARRNQLNNEIALKMRNA